MRFFLTWSHVYLISGIQKIKTISKVYINYEDMFDY